MLTAADSRQPTANANVPVSLVVSGEILSDREVGAPLGPEGREIRSPNPAEVAAHAFEDSPDAFPKDLRRRVTAFVAWNRSDAPVAVVVERLGVHEVLFVNTAHRLKPFLRDVPCFS